VLHEERAMSLIALGYEFAAFWLMAAGFAWQEHRRPARIIDARAGLWLDVVGLNVTVLTVLVARQVLQVAIAASPLPALLEALAFLRALPLAVKVLFALVLADFTMYWLHRLMHTAWLWNSHKMHHSPSQLYWLSGFRASVIHNTIYTFPQSLFGYFVFGFSAMETTFLFCFGMFWQFWLHSNIDVNLGWFNWLILTPQGHRRHHASNPELAHGNFGTLFLTIWDRMFGTYIDPATEASSYELGLVEPVKAPRMVLGV
jgi:sterol desaturase/sphingolipid hydroxylase (fatty acid hydroxylase superfamily)